MRISPLPFRRDGSLRALPIYLIFAAALALALLGFVRVIPTLLQVPTQIDFAAYYVAGRMLNAHVALYRANPLDDVALGIAGIHHTGYIYPPFFASILRPLALLPYRLAESVWFLGNLLLFVLVCVLLLQWAGISKRWSIALLLGGMLLPAVYDTWLLGQVSILLTMLLLGSVALAVHTPRQARNDLLAGMLLGLAAAIKIYPIVLSAIYLQHRRWSALLGMLISLVGAFLIGSVFGGGWATTQDWFSSVLPSVSGMVPFPSNQSLRGVVARFFTINTFQVPVLTKDNYVNVTVMPILNNPALSAGVIALSSAAVIIITAWVLLRRSAFIQHDLLSLDFAIGTTLMLIITPVVWDLYYVHLLLPLVLLASISRFQPRARLALALACLLLALQRYWRYALLYVQSPWFMICGFLAVVLLWAALLIVRWQSSTQQ